MKLLSIAFLASGLLLFGERADAATFMRLHTFGGTDVRIGPVAAGKDGKLYGVVVALDGMYRGFLTKYVGTFYESDPKSGESKTLRSFGAGVDGGLVVGAQDGLIYGLTVESGTNCMSGYGSPNGCGTLFSFDPVTGLFKILHSFTGGDDGAFPETLVEDGHGLIYGMTYTGGSNANCGGTIFSFDPKMQHFETIAAIADGRPGADPHYQLAIGPNNRLYFTRNADLRPPSDDTSVAAVFEYDLDQRKLKKVQVFGDEVWDLDQPLVYKGSIYFFSSTGFERQRLSGIDLATHKLTVLKRFVNKENRVGPVVVGPDDALYGTTASGGENNWGSIFKFDLASKELDTLHSFITSDHEIPTGGMVLGNEGAFYGTSEQAVHSGASVFQFKP